MRQGHGRRRLGGGEANRRDTQKNQKNERNLYSNSEREGQMLKQNYYCRFACP